MISGQSCLQELEKLGFVPAGELSLGLDAAPVGAWAKRTKTASTWKANKVLEGIKASGEKPPLSEIKAEFGL